MLGLSMKIFETMKISKSGKKEEAGACGGTGNI